MQPSASNPDLLGVPARIRSGTVGSWRSGRSEEFGKSGTTSSKGSSVTSSLKSFASSFIPGRSNKPLSAPAPTHASTPDLIFSQRELTPPREFTPTPPQTPEQGPTTIRLIPSPGPNALLPRSKSAADLLEGVPLATPALNKIATELAAAEEILNGDEDVGARVSFGFAAAGYDDGELEVGDVSMASLGPSFANETNPLPTGTLAADEIEPPHEPFVFGHPRHSVTNNQFGDAAAAVLREMNARMGITGPHQAVSLGQLEGVMANVGKTVAPLKVEKKADIRFKGTHDKEFAKMDSIANHYSVNKKRKSEHTAAPAPPAEPADKIFTLPPHLATTNDPERTTKRARISTADGEPPNKTLSDSPAVRAQLEKRRRSSAAARKSAGGRKSGAAAGSKGGFGFMKMVRGFWGSKPKEPEPVKKHVEVVKKTDPRPEPVKKFPSAPTHEPVVLPSVPKSKIEEKKAVGLGRPSGSGVVPKAGRVASEGGSSTGTIGKSRLYAPTAASLARQGAAVKPTATTTNVTRTNTVRSRAATTGTVPADGPKPARPLPVPPTTVARAATSNTAMQGSAKVASPPTRAATTAGLGRKSTAGTRTSTGIARSPSGARKSIFTAPLTVDAMTMRGSAPTVQPFRLSPHGNLNSASGPVTRAESKPVRATSPASANSSRATSPSVARPKPTISTIPLKSGAPASKPPPTAIRPARRPRISRSKVIARLGEKRAAASIASPSNKALSPKSKARSSLQARRSVGGVAAKRALEADRIRARRSEAASRKTRIEERGLVGRRSEGSVLKRR